MSVEDSKRPLAADELGENSDSGDVGAFGKLAFYGSSRTISQGLVSARGILLASLLGPERFGVWALFRIAMLWGSFASLSIFRGLELEVAQARAGRDPESGQVRTACGAALALTLAISGLVGLASLSASFLVKQPDLVLVLRVFAVAVVLESLVVYAITYLRAAGWLRRYGLAELALALVHLSLAVLLALRWGLGGAFLGYLLASVLVLPFVLRAVPFRLSFSQDESRRLLQIGFPVALTSILGFALAGVDRLVVGAFAGLTSLGFYAFAMSVSGLTASLAWVVRTVVLPEVYARAKTEGTSLALQELLERVLLPFSQIYPLLVGVLAIAVGPAVSLLLPEYLEAVSPARVLIFDGVIAGFVSLGSLGVVAAGKQRVLPILSAPLLLLNALIAYLALTLGFGILGVAVGTFVSRAGFGVSIVAFNALSAAPQGVGRVVVGVSIPLLWCAAVVFGLDRWLGGTDLQSAGLSLLAYLALVSPLYPGAAQGLRRWR
jgi:O-antigen/teichoic acid export membrane protein